MWNPPQDEISHDFISVRALRDDQVDRLEVEEIDPQSVKTVAQVQEMVRYYEKICKENGRTPTKKAQELINQLPEKQKKK